VTADRATPLGVALAGEATAGYRAFVNGRTAAFGAAVGQLEAELQDGDLDAARSDELAAQSAYDGFRELENGNTVMASLLDEQVTDVGPDQTFAGLHAVEQDLWSPVPADAPAAALTDTGSLVAQAPVVAYLLAREQLAPATIGTTAVDQLGWVNDVGVREEAEPYSHLDAVDIAATASAARSAFLCIQPLARSIAPALTASVADHFAMLTAQVGALGPPLLRPDDTLSVATRRDLAQQVNGTAGLLAQLSALLVPYGVTPTSS